MMAGNYGWELWQARACHRAPMLASATLQPARGGGAGGAYAVCVYTSWRCGGVRVGPGVSLCVPSVSDHSRALLHTYWYCPTVSLIRPREPWPASVDRQRPGLPPLLPLPSSLCTSPSLIH